MHASRRRSFPGPRSALVLVMVLVVVALFAMSAAIQAPATAPATPSASEAEATETPDASLAESTQVPDQDPRLTLQTRVLVFDSSNVKIAVSSNRPSVQWILRDVAGATLDSGDTPTARGAASIDFDGLDSGYYGISISVDEGRLIKDTSFAVLHPLHPANNPLFAASDHLRTQPDQVEIYSYLGIFAVRFDITWSTVERAKGEYTFDPARDAKVQAIIDQGLRPLVILDYRNGFYDDNRTPSSPEAIAAFADYAAAVAEHYGTAADYEVYNEFDVGYNDGACGRTADCYLQLLKPTYNAIKAAAPDARVVGPATARIDLGWLSRLIELGGLEYLDVVSVHTYDYPKPPEGRGEAKLKQLKALLRQHGDKPLWVTEYGWSTSRSVTDAMQAKYLVRGSVLLRVAGATRMFVYDLIEDGTAQGERQHHFGIVRNAGDGLRSLAPKQAYVSYAVMARMLEGVRYVGAGKVGTGTHAYEFRGGGKPTTFVLWSTAAKSVRVSTEAPVTVTSMLGATSTYDPQNGSVDLQLDDRPVYVSGDGITGVSGVPMAG